MERKINVLVVPSDKFGCGLYRSVQPHVMLQEMFGDEFDVEINYEPNWKDLDGFKKYDIIHFHKGLFANQEDFWAALKYFKENNITTVMDVDDNWNLGPQHPLFLTHRRNKGAEKMVYNLKHSDYVTTTTNIFAKQIKPHNKNCVVFPNAVNPDEEQYQPIKNESSRIRFGFVMGSSHERDMEYVKGVFSLLPKEYLDKIQVVLCGFDLRGYVNEVDLKGNTIRQRPIQPTESVWYRYEKNVTNNYSLVSPEYAKFLNEFKQNEQWPDVENEPYRREWTKDVSEFAKHYRNIDVLLVPLDTNSFNEVKSELKFIEGGFTNTAVIATEFGPYTIGSKNFIERGGVVNPEGNAILINPRKGPDTWAKMIKKLVDNPEYIKQIAKNMHDTVCEKYDIRNVTKKRAEWYKSIVKKSE